MRNWCGYAVRCLLYYNVLAAAVATWTVFSFSLSTAPIGPDWAAYSLLFPRSKSLISKQHSHKTSTHLHCTHFNLENDSNFFQNVCVHRTDCTVSQYRRTESKFPPVPLPVTFTAFKFVPVSGGIKCEITESEFNIKYSSLHSTYDKHN